MNDSELLKFAAKAAGIEQVYCYESRRNCLRIGDKKSYYIWNPLTDDGDALRLAVKLGVSLEIDSIHCDDPQVATFTYGDEMDRREFGSDPYAATRRAIVRAAAEIGWAMP